MNYGYICFAYSKNEWIAKAIAWFTKSQWSHSFLTISPALGQEMAMEAASGGVEVVLFNSAYRNNVNEKFEVYRVKLPDETINGALVKTLANLEAPYGYLEYLWFIWRSVCLLFGKDIKAQNNWIQQGTVCSGLVRTYMQYLGLGDLFGGFGKDSATAQDVYNIVKSNPNLFELVEFKN